VFNDLKRSLESDGPISSLWATRVEAEHRSVARSIFEGVPREESYALITSCSDVVDFLSRLNLIRRLDSSLIAIRVEAKYISVVRSLSVWGFKGELDSMYGVLRRLKLIRRSNSPC
jgi:hypothetical protein